MNMDANTSWNYTNMPDVTCAMCYTTMMEMPKVVVSSIIDEAVTPDQSTFCDNGTATISTGTSADGIQYYLRDDSDDSVIDGPIEGDGSSIDFSTGSISTTTTYNVYAESIESSLFLKKGTLVMGAFACTQNWPGFSLSGKRGFMIS